MFAVAPGGRGDLFMAGGVERLDRAAWPGLRPSPIQPASPADHGPLRLWVQAPMIAYRDAVIEDAPAIDALFRQSFIETFAHLYDPADLAAFFAKFTQAAWREEISDRGFAFRLAEEDGLLAGFCKISPVTLPVEAAAGAIELRQLYVARPWHGAGIAPVLMDWALERARGRGAAELYLTVFTDNHRARRFYARYGFEAVGSYAFMVGTHADEDIIMRLKL